MVFVSNAEASKALNVSIPTLHKYGEKGLIETYKTPGGHRMYNVDKFLEDNGIKPKVVKHRVCYCRVSSAGQKPELENQKKYMSDKYPDHELISDIGSGINFKRKGFRKIVEYAVEGELEELVISYKDRLCRIGYDLLEFLFTKYSNTNIIVDKEEEEITSTEEMANDVMEIITVFSAKMHGKRSYKIED
jgi:predicted site-specific integrase-resolvase